jgi:cytochrome oxidase Cu insertion factor (SCO1/SenC/PrrC family)
MSDAATAARRYKILRCRLFAEVPATGLALGLDRPGDIRMKVNDKAPDFTLQDEEGKEVALKDLRGKTVVLFFYPRASTPG